MEVIVLARNGGKTSTIIEQVLEDPDGVYVSFTRADAERVKKETLKRYNKEIRVTYFAELFKYGYDKAAGTAKTNYYIDNLDQALSRLIRGRIKIVTFTKENDN